MLAPLGALLASFVLFLSLASSASAITFGMMWSGDLGRDTSEMEAIQHSGAGIYHMPIEMNKTNGATDWSAYDPIFTAAWEHGITIVPGIGTGGQPFIGPKDSGWSTWPALVKAAVKRYGPGGDFWAGKSNPRPVTTWEVGNEPNLPENNPQVSKEECEKHGWKIFNKENGEFNNCVQPEKYGEFLVYTSTAIHAQSSSANVNFGGLAFPYGENFESFLKKAYTVANLYSSYTSLAIHPYDYDSLHTNGDKNVSGVKNEINNVRSYLNTLQWGPSRSLWIGELGWPLSDYGDKRFPQVKDEAEQARLLKESFDWIKSEASSKNIVALFWYNIRDLNVANWAYSCGLRDQNGNYRQSWKAYQEEANASPWPSPAVETKPASGVQEEQATLNGAVNPNRRSTTYHFEYGPNTNYGSSIPIPNGNAGEGGSSVAVSVPVAGLEAATTYHYRLVATNAAGTSYSNDVQFTTRIAARPSAVIDPANGLTALWRGSDGNLYDTVAPGGKWTTFSPTWGALGGVSVTANPSAVIDPANGLTALWRGSDGNLYETAAPGGKSWTTFSPTWNSLPAGVTVSGSPSAVIDPANGLTALWRGSDGNLYETVAVGGKWTTFSPTWGVNLGGVKVTGSPSAVIDPANGLTALWRGSDGNLYETVAPGGKWTTFSPTWGVNLGGVTVTGSPSAVIDKTNGLAGLWRGSDGNLYETVAPGGKWTTFSPTWGALGGITVTGSPSAVIDPTNGLATLWRGSDGNLYETVAVGGKWTTFSPTWGALGGVTLGE